MLCFGVNDYVESIKNEENDWDHDVDEDAAERPVV